MDVSAPRRSTSAIGAQAELAVSSALSRAGFAVFIPLFNAHCRVDLVYLDATGRAQRVQCKSARLVNHSVTFYTRSHTGGVERGYVGDIDLFGIFCEENGLVYLVPVEVVPSRVATLRLKPPRNRQVRGVRWAAPYELGRPW